MSPKFYGLLWVVVAIAAGVLWLGNVFTMLTVVVFGFIAFGMVFTGMICVLPGTVSHPAVSKLQKAAPEKEIANQTNPVEVPNERMHFPIGLKVHRTAR